MPVAARERRAKPGEVIIQQLLQMMETMGPAGQRHALLEANGIIRITRGSVALTCQGIEVEAADDGAAVAAWRAEARRRMATGEAEA